MLWALHLGLEVADGSLLEIDVILEVIRIEIALCYSLWIHFESRSDLILHLVAHDGCVCCVYEFLAGTLPLLFLILIFKARHAGTDCCQHRDLLCAHIADCWAVRGLVLLALDSVEGYLRELGHGSLILTRVLPLFLLHVGLEPRLPHAIIIAWHLLAVLRVLANEHLVRGALGERCRIVLPPLCFKFVCGGRRLDGIGLAEFVSL